MWINIGKHVPEFVYKLEIYNKYQEISIFDGILCEAEYHKKYCVYGFETRIFGIINAYPTK